MEKAPEYCVLAVQWWPICMNKSEWAAWAQAVFSVLAIVAAIGVAWWQRHAERRHAALAAKVRAEVAGMSVLLLLSPILGGLGAARTLVTSVSDEPNPSAAPAVSDILQSFRFASEHELGAIVEHSPVAAGWLARGKHLLVQAETALRIMIKFKRAMVSPGRDEQTTGVLQLLTAAIHCFEEAWRELDKFVPTPPSVPRPSPGNQ